MKRVICSSAGLVLLLPACGGGGGGGTPAATVAITTANAFAVAEAILVGGTDLDNVSGGIDQLFEQLDPGGNGTFPCPDGGTYTVDAGSTSGKLTFNGCEFVFGEELSEFNGTLSFRQTGVSTIAFTIDLTVSSASDTTTVRGDMTVELRDPVGDSFTTIIRGNKLTVTSDGFSQSLERYRFEETVNIVTGAYTATQRGTIRNSLLGGTLNFETLEPLQGTAPDEPVSGVVEVRGSDGSVQIITIDGEDITVETDENGDDLIDDTFVTSWAELIG